MINLTLLEAKFVDLMVEQAKLGRPYVWGGKGDRVWLTPEKTITTPPEWGGDVFDCAGLITTMIKRAGGPDLCLTHGAKHLRAESEAAEFAQREQGYYLDVPHLRCRYYPRHVAFVLRGGPQLQIIEASGGGQTTLQPAAGKVRWGKERRSDFEGEFSLSALLIAHGYFY